MYEQPIEKVHMKYRYTFTLPPDLVSWLRDWSKDNYTNMSSVITGLLYEHKKQHDVTLKTFTSQTDSGKNPQRL